MNTFDRNLNARSRVLGWAGLKFLPGFVAGNQAFDWGPREPVAKIVRIAASRDFAWRAFRSGQPSQTVATMNAAHPNQPEGK